MIEIKVNGQIVSVQETLPLYSGSADVHRCRFTFDKSWNGFSKTAVFRVGAATHTELIEEDDCCTLPWELLTRRNIGRQLEVGVYGVSADTEIMTSVWDTLGAIREGSQPGGDARNPVDGIYEQIMAKLQRIYEAVGIYDDGIHTLIQRAETAAQLAQESAETAARKLEEIRETMHSGGGDSPYCVEYGTLAYNGEETKELTFHFSQSYESEPVFIPYVDSGELVLTVEPLQSEMGFYGGKVTVTNTSGEMIEATVAMSAYCAQPTGGESEGE